MKKIIVILSMLLIFTGNLWAQKSRPTNYPRDFTELVDWILTGQETFTYKTLTTPTITGGTFTGLGATSFVSDGDSLEIDMTALYSIDLEINGTRMSGLDTLGNVMAATAFVPDAANGATLGTTALEFSDAYLSDGGVLYFGADQDVSLTHVADAGLLLNAGMYLTFRDNALKVYSSADGQLDIDADTEIELTATTVDLNGLIDVSGTITGGSTVSAASSFIPDAADGATIGTADLEFSDMYLADAGVIYFGADQDVSLTHVADTGILLNAGMAFQFRDAALTAYSSADGQLDIDADTEIELTTTTVDLNGALDISGATTTAGSYDATIVNTTAGGETGLYSYLSHDTNALTGELIGVRGNGRVNIASPAGTVIGGKFQAGNMTAGYALGTATGVYVDVVNKDPSGGATAWTNARGYEVSMDLNQGTAGNVNTVTNAYMFYGVYNLPTVDTYATVTNGYGIFVRNEAVGGTGQMIDAAFYADDLNQSGGVHGWDYGIDFSGIGSNSGSFGSADIRLANGEEINNSTDGTITITDGTNTLATITDQGTTGNINASGDFTVTDNNGATLAASGDSLVSTNVISTVNKTTITTSTQFQITMTDAAANGCHGSIKILDFPEGVIKIHGVTFDVVITAGAGGIADDATYDVGLGSTTVGTDNEELSTTEQNILTKIEGDLSSGTATLQTYTVTDLGLDGHSSASDVYLNVAIMAADASADDLLDIIGTITIVWSLVGDY